MKFYLLTIITLCFVTTGLNFPADAQDNLSHGLTQNELKSSKGLLYSRFFILSIG